MNKERINQIMNTSGIDEVYYNGRPVWIQNVENDFAQVGFIDSFEEKTVPILDLYEKKL